MSNAPDGTWIVDPVHSSVTFTICVNGLASLGGRFGAFAGTITFDEDGAHSARGSVQTGSIDTNFAERDEYLRGEPTFDAGDHPELAFATDELAVDADGAVLASGDLTMRGTTRPITLRGSLTGPLVDAFEVTRIGVDLTGTTSIGSFGIGGLPIVDDAVEIHLGLQAVAAEPA